MGGSISNLSHNVNPASGSVSKSSDSGPTVSSDLTSFCDALKEGFASVSQKLSEKIDNVESSMSRNVQKVQKSFDKKLEEMSRRNDHEVSDSDSAMAYGFDADTESDSDQERADTESTRSTADNESFFKKLNKPPPAERVGEKVNEDLAEATDRFFRKPISTDEFKELKTKYVRPENVQWLRAPSQRWLVRQKV